MIATETVNHVPTTPAELLVYEYGLETNDSRLFLNDDGLVSKVDEMLQVLYSEYPSVEYDEYSPWIGYRLNYLTLVPVEDSDLYEALHAINESVDGSNFSTGIEAFDSIHDQAPLSAVTRLEFYSWDDWFYLEFENGWINLEEVTDRYSVQELEDQIDFVEVDGWMGGAQRDITMEYGQNCDLIPDNYVEEGECWIFTFIKAWGDCPAGCTHSASATCQVQMDGYGENASVITGVCESAVAAISLAMNALFLLFVVLFLI